MIILGIETSCDETALALIETRGSGDAFECRILKSLIHSQAELHSEYGGVYPNLAKREHLKNLPILFEQIMQIASPESLTPSSSSDADRWLHSDSIEPGSPSKSSAKPFDLIAVTEGPGLEPALWTGITFAEELSKQLSVPVIPINHMEGHVVGSLLQSDSPDGVWQKLKPLPLPALAFLISGGHTEFVKVSDLGSYEIIGQTKDDAVGEAYDKVARLLGLGYPGGARVSRLADEAEAAGIQPTVKLPRPMISSKDLNFSFSGLKTAVLYAIRNVEKTGTVTDSFKKELALEFERAVAETLSSKLRDALEATRAQSLIIGGGVSANRGLRQAFETIAREYDIPLYLPTQHVSGDNALMIALAGALNQKPPREGGLRAQGTKRLGNI